VLAAEHLDEVRAQLRRGGWAVRSLPDLHYIEVSPDRLSGRPTIEDDGSAPRRPSASPNRPNLQAN
jgi:hypothetical protein